MATPTAKGSIILKLLIVILSAALVATILYPKKIWEQEERNTNTCRTNMDRIFKAEMIYLQHHNNYTDNLDQLISFIKDSSKTIIREYIKADTALAEQMLNHLVTTDSRANSIINNLTADTLLFSILEAVNYDSNLAHVMLNRLEKTEMGSAIKEKREIGISDVDILKEIDRTFGSVKIYDPLKTDDSLSLVFRRMMPDVPVGSLLDTLYVLGPKWAEKIDSAVNQTVVNFKYCPTVNREYKIAIIDTSAFKYVNIECPVDSSDIQATKNNFVKYHFGHHRISNHGKVETGEKSWTRR
ncbi:MAG: hypothetical protein ONB31_07705 [candidate division KSB1 bacterium]|nr:hypothetical protein [candidate division KSB1 bacterium]MDZ7335251.1 hypothetical protein [candidate division KSB1 bacterium]MDZ7357999.1 hypothetical protein [candidate division KSB1 bacterium]MDZ7399788.1 hypothetical protein [candidate division KSB1 bacterium]